jgi:hypothetical protein
MSIDRTRKINAHVGRRLAPNEGRENKKWDGDTDSSKLSGRSPPTVVKEITIVSPL